MDHKICYIPSPSSATSSSCMSDSEELSESSVQETSIIDLLIKENGVSCLSKKEGDEFFAAGESSDFNEKVKKLIEELDSFQVNVSSPIPSSNAGNFVSADADSMSTDDSSASTGCGNDSKQASSSNILTQSANNPVLEATNLESLLEKFEATEIASTVPDVKVTAKPTKKAYRKTLPQRGPILIPPVCKKKSRCAAGAKMSVGKTASVRANLDSNQAGFISSYGTDHDYCFNSAERKTLPNIWGSGSSDMDSSSEFPSLQAAQGSNVSPKPPGVNFVGSLKANAKPVLNDGEDPLEGTSTQYNLPVQTKRKCSPPKGILPTERENDIERNAEREKIVYVGRVPSAFSCRVLKSIFSKYGEIANATLYFRKSGDNYGFVTFRRSEDATNVLASHLTDPDIKDFDVCYGARRAFCKRLYSDLDSESSDDSCQSSATLDFDKLLQDAKAKIARKK